MTRVRQVTRWLVALGAVWAMQPAGVDAQFNRYSRSIDYRSSARTSTAVSGRSGTARPLNTDAEPLPLAGVLFLNIGTKTCTLKSRTRHAFGTSDYDDNLQATSCPTPVSGVVTRQVDAPAATFVTGLEVCLASGSDTTTGDRIAGVRLHLSRVEADGTVVAMNANESAAAPDCANWQPRVDCPANSLAVNVIAQTNPQGLVRGGLALSCAPLVGPGLLPARPNTTWGLNLATHVNGAGATAPAGATTRRIETDGMVQSVVVGRGSDGRVCALQAVVRTITQGAAEGNPRLYGEMRRTGLCAVGQPVVWADTSGEASQDATAYRVATWFGLAEVSAGFTRQPGSFGNAQYRGTTGSSLPILLLAPAIRLAASNSPEFDSRYCPDSHLVTGVIAYESNGAYVDQNVICSPMVLAPVLSSGARSRPR